jgi:predicted ATPase
MQALPTGTVTFLFTDIEGSTRLLHELGERYAHALAEHRRVLRDAFARHGGVEVDTQGDAFVVAFARATDALAAATEGRDALAAGPIRVRMGLHTGEPLLTEEGYLGIDVHRAARIAAAGHGGQILVSQSTRDLASGEALRDLGEHRLKDLTAPERIYQLADGDFPPLKSLDHTNLPLAGSALVGREPELRELVELLSNGARLVTLTGPGGSGKTRLALQAAGELVATYDDVWFVPLAPLYDAELVLPTVAQTVGASGELSETLRGKRTLLVLDNFEHLLDASPGLAELLRNAEGVRVLATSRSPLRIGVEHEVPLDPLPDFDAATLFVERARAAGRRLELDDAVIEICRRLDGLPLAVELAAARSRLLDPKTMLRRLDQRLPLLTGGPRDAPERQRTLRDTIAWSHGLLPSELQALFRRLAVFAGGCSLEAAEAVCNVSFDEIAALVEASLLKPLGTGRFLMLETIREYGLDRLQEAGEAQELEAAHAAHFLELAEQAGPHLSGGGAEQSDWFRRLEEERDNLRAAIAFLSESPEADPEMRIVVATWDFWWLHGYVPEARRYLDHALARGVPRDRTGVNALEGAAYLAYLEHDVATANRRTTELRVLAEELHDDLASAKAVHMSALLTENADERIVLEQRALELAADDPYARFMHEGLGVNALGQSDLDTARAHLEQSLRICRSIGDSSTMSSTLELLAYVAVVEQREDEAVRLLREAVQLARELGDVSMMFWGRCWTVVAGVLTARGAPEAALHVLGAAERIREESGTGTLAGHTLRFHDEVVAHIRELLSEDAVADAWAHGRAEASEEVLEQALRDLG